MVGSRDGQLGMLARSGGRAVHGVVTKFIAEYDDEVAAMQFDLDDPPPRVAARLEAVGRLLGLDRGRRWEGTATAIPGANC